MHTQGRQKPFSQKTPVEKVTSTLKTKLSKYMEELATHARTPETIEYEIMHELDMFYADKSQEAKSILATYRTAIATCEQSKRLLVNNIALMNTRLDDAKERYENADDTKRKQIVAIAESAMATKKNVLKCLDETAHKIDELLTKKQDIEDQIELFVTSFNIKKVEILNHIATIKSVAICNPNFHTNFNISSLVDDLDMAINSKIDDAKVDSMFNAASGNDMTISSMTANVDEDIKNETLTFLTGK